MPSFLITGRSLKNYREKGQTVPAEYVILKCLVCGEPVALSAEGGVKLAERVAAGDGPAGAVCTPCVLIVSAGARPHEIHTTRFGADLVERRDDAKAVLDFLMERSRS